MESVGNILRGRLEIGKVEETIMQTTKSPDDLDVALGRIQNDN